MSTYCEFAKNNPIHQYYHNKEYGFPVTSDNVLFERLALEMNQAGLSWELMLKKRKGFNKAFNNFAVDKVARFSVRDVKRLLQDENIVRNRLKIEAVIHNAKLIKTLQKQEGSFHNWLQINVGSKTDIKELIKLFKKTGFKFVGGEILKEFLQSVGYLKTPHSDKCLVGKEIFKAKVLAVVKDISKGETMTYGEVAAATGKPAAARAVGALMRNNQNKQIPCHRVVAKTGLGGYNGLRGKSKAKLLADEQITQ